MGIKSIYILSICIFVTSENLVHASTATCKYKDSKSRRYTGYMCELTTDGSEIITEIIGEHIPGKTDADVTYVGGSKVSIKKITSLFCEKFNNLQVIAFSAPKLDFVETNAFKKCPKLEQLELNDGKLEEIPEDLLSENKELKVIKLNKNHLLTLPENLFRNNVQLTRIFLFTNQISSLPRNIFKPITNLTGLFLNENKISAIEPEWFVSMPDLLNLDLSQNEITELPIGIFANLRKLKMHELSRNKLTIIHADSFPSDGKIEMLYVDDNRIQAIDPKIVENIEVGRVQAENNLCVNKDLYGKERINKGLDQCYRNYKPREM